MQQRVDIISLFLCLSLLCACRGPENRAPRFSSTQLFAPTKDDVLWVDGRRLSLSGYMALRGALPETTKKDDLLWIATAALAYQNDAISKGQEVKLTVGVDLARVALGQIPLNTDLQPYASDCAGAPHPAPSVLKQRLEALISRSAVQRNSGVLAELR